MAATAINNSSKILRFTVGVPETFALKFNDGKDTTGPRSGDAQVLYSLEDGRSLYADMSLVEEFRQIGLSKGQLVQSSPSPPHGGAPVRNP